MIIHPKINELLTEITKIVIEKNDLWIKIQPFSTIRKENPTTSEQTEMEVGLPIYNFDLTKGVYKLNDMRVITDILTELPRKLRGKKLFMTQSFYVHYYDAEPYQTIKDIIEVRDPYTELTENFNLYTKYDYDVDPFTILMRIPDNLDSC